MTKDNNNSGGKHKAAKKKNDNNEFRLDPEARRSLAETMKMIDPVLAAALAEEKRPANSQEGAIMKPLKCPHCSKDFLSEYVLQYHVDKKVCQRKYGNSKPNTEGASRLAAALAEEKRPANSQEGESKTQTIGEKRPANSEEGASKPDAPKKKKKKKKSKPNQSNKTTFPTNLFNMLQNEDASVVSWTSSGDAFIIRDTQRFINDVLPRVLPRSTKLTSFHRQLNVYGFRRIVNGSYRHDLFQRDNNQYQQIKRVVKKSDTDTQISDKGGKKRKAAKTDSISKKKRSSIEKATKEKSKVAPKKTPVEVLDPYTFRRVKLYQSVAAGVAAGVATPTGKSPQSLTKFLDKGGGYIDGLIYRYQHHYKGIPRKTVAELVASVVATKSDVLPRKKSKSQVKKPPRPYTAYNIFFQLERERILGELIEKEEKKKNHATDKGEDGKNEGVAEDTKNDTNKEVDEEGDKPYPTIDSKGRPLNTPSDSNDILPRPPRFAHLQLSPLWYDSTHRLAESKRKQRNRDKHRKPHGLVDFSELTKMITKEWKNVDSITKSYCKRVADRQLVLYKEDSEKKQQLVAPKESRTAYIFFMADKRADIKEANPNTSFGEIAKLLGAAWKALSDDDKAEYIEKSEKDVVRYQKEMEDYTAVTVVKQLPVEVLDSYTLRRVKVYPSVSAAATSFNAKEQTISVWLKKGGFYKDGLIYRYLNNYEDIPRKTIVELVASVVNTPPKKKRAPKLPVEVLDPYTCRRVKVYKHTSSKALLQFLDKGGGLYSDGFVYRYLHDYQGIPRKTIVELVASVVAGDISKCSRHGCTGSRHVDCHTNCRTCHIVLQKIATFQNQLGCELESVGFAKIGSKVRVNGFTSSSLPDFHKIQKDVLGILHADRNGHEGKWYEKDIPETNALFDWAHSAGIRRVFILRYDHKDYIELSSRHKDAIIDLITSLFDDDYIDPVTGYNFMSPNPGNDIMQTVIYLNYAMKSTRFLEGVREFGCDAIRAEFDEEDGSFSFISDEKLREYINTESNSRALYLALNHSNSTQN